MRTLTLTCALKALNAELLAGDLKAAESVPVKGGCACDLLSWVMAKGEADFLWMTVQGHVNAAAVCLLRDMPAIVLTCGRSADADLILRCQQENIFLASTQLTTFEA
ncbi:MAG: hypothetical protein SOZ52_02115, partial [Pyramidobacter sp.]|nr:hypothetical protein [Pyramidobacter sp.]